jgi:hypothetical protein
VRRENVILVPKKYDRRRPSNENRLKSGAEITILPKPMIKDKRMYL